jgi:alkanesulfonate monooxygenase SsuD/methylene tetrahydromethanopterin reductase-like flavin-dependent oxidoreductase (luciferase family)
VGDTRALPIGVNLVSLGVSSAWWLEAARRLEAAGFASVWCWDHFMSRWPTKIAASPRPTDPVLECWTTVTAAAALTRRLRVGSFVLNVMNRHPAVLARMAATLQEQSAGRLDLGIGIGGHPHEHAAMGLDYPEPAERAARLAEAIELLRRLWSGGPVSFEGRYHRLRDACAYPVPTPAPRIVVGGQTRAGARLAGALGVGWTAFAPTFARDLPVYREARGAAAGAEARGRAAEGQARAAEGQSRAAEGRGQGPEAAPTIVAVELDREAPPARQPILADLAGEAQRWAEAGADELILAYVRPHQLDAVLAAARVAGLPDGPAGGAAGATRSTGATSRTEPPGPTEAEGAAGATGNGRGGA